MGFIAHCYKGNFLSRGGVGRFSSYSADMKHLDMRALAPAAQEERRRQVIGLRQSGASYAAIAAQVGQSRTGAFDICKRFDAKGKKGLVSGKRGRKPDEQRLLTTAQET